MKPLKIIILIMLIGTASVFAYNAFKPISEQATCKGETPCKACKNCKYCKYCSKPGNNCGKCKK